MAPCPYSYKKELRVLGLKVVSISVTHTVGTGSTYYNNSETFW
jgi:hypothetical protein